MKKLFLFALVAIGMVACNNSNDIISDPTDEPIDIDVYIDPETGKLINETSITSEDFVSDFDGVWKMSFIYEVYDDNSICEPYYSRPGWLDTESIEYITVADGEMKLYLHHNDTTDESEFTLPISLDADYNYDEESGILSIYPEAPFSTRNYNFPVVSLTDNRMAVLSPVGTYTSPSPSVSGKVPITYLAVYDKMDTNSNLDTQYSNYWSQKVNGEELYAKLITNGGRYEYLYYLQEDGWFPRYEPYIPDEEVDENFGHANYLLFTFKKDGKCVISRVKFELECCVPIQDKEITKVCEPSFEFDASRNTITLEYEGQKSELKVIRSDRRHLVLEGIVGIKELYSNDTILENVATCRYYFRWTTERYE